jgi:hypothetical protein
MDATRALIQAKESVEHDFLKQPNVTGVAVGYKYVRGKRTDQVSVQVFVKEKKKVVPKAEMVPPEINGVPTDVIERTFKLHPAMKKVLELEIMADTGTYSPVKGGISIGPCRAIGGFVFAGTLGVPVRDRATGNPLLLSNFHVMAVDTGWSVGDQMTQPSRVDTGSCPGGVVGTLLRAVLTSSVDGAVCTLSGRGSACEIVDIGAVNGTNTAALNMAVRKRGRTTGLTFGTVDSISLSVNVDYGDGIGAKTLTNQIGLQPDTSKNPKFGDHGDSGSVVVDSSGRVVGLYFAGSDDGSGVANPIAAVLDALNIDLCTGKSILKDLKDRKIEIKEHKREKPELKEAKHEKPEIKEKREKIEKPEIKESKEIKFEKLEKPEIKEKVEIFEGGPKIPDTDPKGPREGPQIPGIPTQPGGPLMGSGSLEERVAQLEATLGTLTAFIGPELRPELSSGALIGEPDFQKTSQELHKQAADAAQAKVTFDNKAGG